MSTKQEETPVEEVETTTTETPVEASETTSPETANETFVEQEAKNEAEVADAKNVSTHTTAALNETKPADEAQLDRNEELERQ